MRIFRFMSIEEFKNYLNGEDIKGRFVKGKACFLEESVPARKKENPMSELTDLPLDFKSTDFEGQMKELSELISPIFENGDFEGQLQEMEHLTLADFMSKVREGVTADVLVEFETTQEFEQECERVIMAYRDYLIQEVQSNGYSINTLNCISYRIDLEHGFKDGTGVDTIPKSMFEGVEQSLMDLEEASLEKETREDDLLLGSVIEITESKVKTSDINREVGHIRSIQKVKELTRNTPNDPQK